jgi:predicted regulator of Ras-like GTPase activity (Roadblock/LC7/MglB family)/alkylhydroperoxidase/carboxymuconolactone decarboxylase family protein YurZ
MADEIRRLSDDLARDPSSLVFMPLADALRRAGQLDVALRVALRGLDRHPYLADAHDVLARIHADRGDLERAADEWEMALRLDPAHAQANLGLGFVDFRRGNLENAERRLSAVGPAEVTPGVTAALAHVRGALGARVRNGSAVEMPNGVLLDAIDAPVEVATPPLAPRIPTSARPTPAVPEFPAPDPSRAKQLFVSALDGADQHALLVDGDGLVLAGTYADSSGNDVADIIAAELAGVSGEAERAMRHLGLGTWTSLLVEADDAVVAMTPAPNASLLVVTASRETPVGLVRLLLDRALTRARDWLARVS